MSNGCGARTAVRCNLSHCWWEAQLRSSSLSKESQLCVDVEDGCDVMSTHQFNRFTSTYTTTTRIHSVWGALCVAYAHSDMNNTGTLQVSTMTTSQYVRLGHLLLKGTFCIEAIQMTSWRGHKKSKRPRSLACFVRTLVISFNALLHK